MNSNAKKKAETLAYTATSVAVGGGAIFRTFHPNPNDLQAISDITYHPVASAAGSLLPAVILMPIFYIWRRSRWRKAADSPSATVQLVRSNIPEQYPILPLYVSFGIFISIVVIVFFVTQISDMRDQLNNQALTVPRKSQVTTASELPRSGAPSPVAIVPSALASGDDRLPPPVDAVQIKNATEEFARQQFGIVGAEIYSEACFKQLHLSRRWVDLDFCVAFDDAAAWTDTGFALVSHLPKNEYFDDPNVGMRHLAAIKLLSSDETANVARLLAIHRAAQAAIADIERVSEADANMVNPTSEATNSETH